MSSNFQLFIDFHIWVDTKHVMVVGTDGLGKDAKYIPFETLKEYWQNRISPILNSCSHNTPIHVPIEDILTRYLRIFSILVYISTIQSPKLYYIKRFTEEGVDDNSLPFKAKPDALPNAPDGVQTFNQFQENQWLFSPVVLGPNRLQSRELLPESVLPFTFEKVLSGRTGESTTVKKCNVHPSSGLAVSTIVLKEFDASEVEFSFKNEVDSYINLENNVLPTEVYGQHFLKYYGSFRKLGKAFIMLEYTDQGSLLDFFNRNELPLERHELYGLWSSLSNLFIGLEHIHRLEQDTGNTNQGTIRCVHQDIKPANIFVFRHSDKIPYHYQFKIADFGMSSIALVRTGNKSVKSPDNMSTKMYGAPELTQHYPSLDSVDYGALWDIDIWSMGCVLFEVLVWTTCGSRGLSEFFEMRRQETDTIPNHASQGYSGCFHNGTARIQAVDKMKDLVVERRRVFDDLSGSIGDLILKEMLRPSNTSRLEARTLLHRFGDLLEPGKQDSKHQEPSMQPSVYVHPPGDPAVVNPRPPCGPATTTPVPVASGRKRNGPEPYAQVTIPEVLEWIDKKKNGLPREPLRDHDRAMREIKDREQIFVVDDSSTMRNQHWDKVVDAVNALGYLVKSADPDGVELFLTSRPTKPKRGAAKEIGSLVRFLKEHQQTPDFDTCNMENSLGPILEHVKSGLKNSKIPKFLQRSRRGTNVYILTDAIWEGGTEVQCGVEEPIKDLWRTMQALRKTRTTVALQFIRFGNDALGEERLQYLDDTLGEELNFDIVDHRHHQRDGVWHMLVGPISRDIDKDNNVGDPAAIT